MTLFLICIFIFGYLAIVFEHIIRVNKTATALFTGVALWVVWSFSGVPVTQVHHELSHHLIDIAEIIFFLLGAMTIVEVIDAHEGFEIITTRIQTTSKRKLLWIVGLLAFSLSPILDNLTTAVVMITLVRKLIQETKDRMLFGGIIIIAANSGGAWSPMGDVTTTMLWIGGQISAMGVMTALFIPSLVSFLVPLGILSFSIKGRIKKVMPPKLASTSFDRNLVFLIGVLGLASVPVFKSITHLPPYLGMLLAVSILWIATEILHWRKKTEHRGIFTVEHALSQIDIPSVLFFFGILAAIGVLDSASILKNLSSWMDSKIGNQSLIVLALGFLSAIVDNVPLVAATMGMYSLDRFPIDHMTWEFLAYCAGTGGSMLIIGSAAGVAVMGIEKINFIWYLRKISLIALIGYLSGAGAYLLARQWMP